MNKNMHSGILLSLQKEEILLLATIWMRLWDIHAKVNKPHNYKNFALYNLNVESFSNVKYRDIRNKTVVISLNIKERK
jgi:hypothetical protein